MKVELHLAYLFDCPECGLENLVRMIRYETDEDVDEEDADVLIEQPLEVICAECGTVLEVDAGEEAEAEDE